MVLVALALIETLTLAIRENTIAPEDAVEEMEKIDSSCDSDREVKCTTEMPFVTWDMEITSTTSRSCNTTLNGNGNSSKKKKVSSDTYLRD
ncbi:hypothetical protein Syun_028029 [Stephania yunnanensis]|uniref:Uncharacterized protein n=1 Tax=Stephania yunnanensis TaxID=152371 RepID=A0AAP0HLJ7_9MAGN